MRTNEAAVDVRPSTGRARRPAFLAGLLVAAGLLAVHQPNPWPLLLMAVAAAVIPVLPMCRGDRALVAALVFSGAAMEISSRSTRDIAAHVRRGSVTAHGIVASTPRVSERFISADLDLLDTRFEHSGLRLRVYLPDTSRVLLRGDTLQVRGSISPLTGPKNPGEIDWSRILVQRGIIGRLWADEILQHHSSWRTPGFRDRVRSHIESTLSAGPGRDEGALALAMLIGIRDLLDQETMASFRDAGIVHILSISGFHVGIVAAIIYAVGSVLPGFRWPALFSLCGVAGYVCLVGPYPPVLRAGVMSAAILIGLAIGRRAEGINSIGLAGLVLLGAQPRWIWEPGFQLSFAATLGILVFAPPMMRPLRRWRRIPRWVVGSVLTSLSAQVGVLPLLLSWFRQWPTYSLLANIPAVLLATVLITASLMATVADLVWKSLAAWCGFVVEHSARLLLGLAHWVVTLPEAVLNFGDPRLWLLTVAWAAAVGARMGKEWSRPLAPALGMGGAAVCSWLVWALVSPWQTNAERISFLHVSHGNCIVLDAGGSIAFLDPGSMGRPEAAARCGRDYLRYRYADSVNLLGATSLRPARYGSVDTLVRELAQPRVVLPPAAPASSLTTMTASFWAEGSAIKEGTRFALTPLGVSQEGLNGLVVRSVGGMKVLIAGDGGWRADAECAQDARVESTDVLYVGPWRDMAPSHLLLRRSGPRLIVLGGGAASEPDVVRDLSSAGYRVAVTSHGAITIECTPKAIHWRQFRWP